MHRTRRGLREFAWQTGYGAFSVSQSSAASVAKYIREQEEHHRRVSFQEEFSRIYQLSHGLRHLQGWCRRDNFAVPNFCLRVSEARIFAASSTQSSCPQTRRVSENETLCCPLG